MGKMFLVVNDAFSKWIKVESMNNVTAPVTVARLRKIFAAQGLPLVIVSDNGPSFVGKEFTEFLERNRVRHILTAPYHPASNGQAENAMRVFNESMKTLLSGDIETKLSRLLFSYRITPHSVTGKSPAKLLLNRQLRPAFSMIGPADGRKLRIVQERMSKNREAKNVHVCTRTLVVGDTVWVKNFGRGKKWLP